jgi:hypothetical protein
MGAMKDDAAQPRSTSIRQLHRLVLSMAQSHFAGKDEQFYVVVLQAAAALAAEGQERLARDLREIAEKSRPQDTLFAGRGVSPTVPLVQPRGELAGIISVSYPEQRLPSLVIDSALFARLERVVREHHEMSVLAGYGLPPRRKLLLCGPPGTGKTYTASAIAGELRLPLMEIRLDALVTRFLGETSQKLRLVFDSIATTRGVYFFDEFDALGSRRGDPNEVGEIRRALNTFLKLLEQDGSASVIIAATNFPDLLDHALFRRFDDVLAYGLPTADDIEPLVRRSIGTFEVSGEWEAVAPASVGLSHADIVESAKDAAKDAILAGSTMLGTQALAELLKARHRTPSTGGST